MAARDVIDLGGLTRDEVREIALIYRNVIAAIEVGVVTRPARAEILARLIMDAKAGRLDAFVSRERALAVAVRHRANASTLVAA